MQLRPRSKGQTILGICLVLAIFFVVSPNPSVAQAPEAERPDADLDVDPGFEPDPDAAPPPAPTPPPGEPIDASKHGTVEAEIPAKRESSAPVPDRAVLKDRLLTPRWDRGGFFLGLGGHYAMEFTDQIGGMGDFASGGGVSMRVGLRHNRFWQTEFTGVYTSKFKDAGVDFWAWGVYLGERFYLTKTRIQPYVGAHVGFLQIRGTNYRGGEFGFVPKVNTGFAFYSRPTFSWDLDLSYYIGEIGAAKDSSFATATLGFTWF